MSKFTSTTTTSKQTSIQSPRTSINIFSKHPATQATPNKLSHSASSSEYVAYVLTTFDNRSEELIKHLIKRGYSRKILQRDANRVRAIPRHETLQSQEQKTTKADRTPFVISFNPALPKISSVVKKHITILQSSTNCKNAFPHPPVIAYKRNASSSSSYFIYPRIFFRVAYATNISEHLPTQP